MPINLELKIKIDKSKQLEKTAVAIGALFKDTLNQKDVYYKFGKGLLKLRIENGEYYLIKYLRDEKGKRWSNYDILKIEGKNVEKYLSEIMKVEATVEKKRKLFLYKNTRIHLDKVKNLGEYLELETVVSGNKLIAEKEFLEVINLLKLNTDKQIKSSYRNLLKK